MSGRVAEDAAAALHQLNNALAAALGRIEICEDVVGQLHGHESAMLEECLEEATRALIHAAGHSGAIAALTCSTARTRSSERPDLRRV